MKNSSYDIWLADQHKRDAGVTFDIFAFGRTDLSYSKLFLKAISRAKKSASKVKIGQIVHHTVFFLKRSRHLRNPDYVNVNICLGCKDCGLSPLNRISSLNNIEHCMSQASKINIDGKQGQ